MDPVSVRFPLTGEFLRRGLGRAGSLTHTGGESRGRAVSGEEKPRPGPPGSGSDWHSLWAAEVPPPPQAGGGSLSALRGRMAVGQEACRCQLPAASVHRSRAQAGPGVGPGASESLPWGGGHASPLLRACSQTCTWTPTPLSPGCPSRACSSACPRGPGGLGGQGAGWGLAPGGPEPPMSPCPSRPLQTASSRCAP